MKIKPSIFCSGMTLVSMINALTQGDDVRGLIVWAISYSSALLFSAAGLICFAIEGLSERQDENTGTVSGARADNTSAPKPPPPPGPRTPRV